MFIRKLFNLLNIDCYFIIWIDISVVNVVFRNYKNKDGIIVFLNRSFV